MRQKRTFFWQVLVVAIALAVAVSANNDAIADENACHYCGMKKAMFGHSWVSVVHDDGSTVGVCSVHCAAVNMALNIDKPIKTITVGDYNTRKQIDADTAFWVIGGDKMGVMTTRAKWAFENKETADGFMKQHGGRPAIFEDVMKAAFEDMYEDTLMIQKKRKMMRMKQ